MKKRIALITDTDNWAFYNRAVILKEELKEDFDIKIIPATTALQDNILQTILLVQDCDLVHFFWRGLLFSLDDDNIVFKRNNLKVDEFVEEKFSKIKKTTCIPDHSLLDDKNISKTIKTLNMVDGYYTMSKKLFNIYSSLDCRKPITHIPGGVSLSKFFPRNLDRFEYKNISNRKIIIGWAGNSKWGEWNNTNNDVKGLRTIIIPAIKELQENGYDIELKIVDKSRKPIPITQMEEFYNSIDVYICASKSEGGPNTVLEAMACGVPIISTDVGVVSEITGNLEKDFIMQKREKEELKKKILALIERREIFKELSNENREEIKKYSYEVIAKQFKTFFNEILNEKENN